jgi:hypothetical protein
MLYLFAIQIAIFIFFIGTIVRLILSLLFDNIKTN